MATDRFRKSEEKSNFTLIELLSVIAIIVLLLSILLPSLSKAKGTAQLAKCTSNLKQIYIGLGTYSNDYNAWYPSHWLPYTPSGVTHSIWTSMLTDMGYTSGALLKTKPYGFVNISSIYYCPSDRLTAATNYKGRSLGFSSYGLNDSWESPSYGACGWQWNQSVFVNSGILARHKTKVMVAEADASITNNGEALVRKNNFSATHNNSGALIFTDGHAATSKFDPSSVAWTSRWYVWSYYYDNAW